MLRRVVIDSGGPCQIGGKQVELSGHAVNAYQERFQPSLRHRDALAHLEGLIGSSGKLQSSRPRWLAGHGGEADGYIVIDDDITLPLRRHRSKPGVMVVPTCLYCV